MDELPTLVTDLALILVLASIVTLLFKRLRQPLVLGYIVAGFLAGPHLSLTPTVNDTDHIQIWANIGVIFLMFSLGLEFSFKKILKMGSSPIIAALSIIFFMSMLGFLVGHSFGWSRTDDLFLGGMLAMSSTTIIYKAFDDLGLQQQRFAGSVLSVLVLEDILGILLMVILSTLAVRHSVSGGTLLDSFARLLFYLALLLLVGIFLIPSLLRKNRKWMGKETLLIVSVGLCFAMVVLAVKLGYSAAFGAFMMGSIFAETIEAETINKLVEPLKNMFGAIFFVSVGMLVDPDVLLEYWPQIVLITLTILLGQTFFGTLSFFISGNPIKMAMRCGFSMAQIGEFAFIIAALGESLHVTAKFLYPIVVAVSVVTTFLTPYMIRLADPSYRLLNSIAPDSVRRFLNKQDLCEHPARHQSPWRRLLIAFLKQTLAYGILVIATILIGLNFLLPLCRHFFTHWPGNAVCGVGILLCIAPFLRAIVMRKNRSIESKMIWQMPSRMNRVGIVALWMLRFVLCMFFIYHVINFLSPYASWVHWIVSFILLFVMLSSRRLKTLSIRLERIFLQNLNARGLQAEIVGKVKPLYATHLLARDMHMAEFSVPENSKWAGHCLGELDFSRRYGVLVASILRGGIRMNIPGARMELFPGDRLQVIAGDDQLQVFSHKLEDEIISEEVNIESRAMDLRCMVVEKNSPFVGKTISESHLRDHYHCMIVGFEEGNENLGRPEASRTFNEDDVVWLVGERESLQSLLGETEK